MDEQQSQKVKAINDQQAEVGNEKKPYHTPTLTRLGNVTQLTKGLPFVSNPENRDGVSV